MLILPFGFEDQLSIHFYHFQGPGVVSPFIPSEGFDHSLEFSYLYLAYQLIPSTHLIIGFILHSPQEVIICPLLVFGSVIEYQLRNVFWPILTE